MSDLWAQYDQANQKIAQAERERARIVRQIRKVPSERDLKICLEWLRDIKRAEIAERYEITEGRVSQIVKECMPHVSGKLRNFQQG